MKSKLDLPKLDHYFVSVNVTFSPLTGKKDVFQQGENHGPVCLVQEELRRGRRPAYRQGKCLDCGFNLQTLTTT